MNDKKYYLNLLKSFVAVGIVYYMLKNNYIDLDLLKTAISSWEFLAMALFILLSFSLAAERLRYLLQLRSYPLSYTSCFRLTLIGLFFNFIVPGGIGGDLTKGFYLAKNEPNKLKESTATIIFDKLIGLYIIILFSFLSIQMGSVLDLNHLNEKIIYNLINLLFLCSNLPFIYFFLLGSLRRKLADAFLGKLKKPYKLYLELESLFDQKWKLLYPLGLTILSQIFIIIFYYIALFKTTGITVDFYILFFICSVGSLLTAIPLTPASIGVGQAVFIFLFSICNFQNAESAATIMTLNQIATFLVSLWGAYFFIFSKKLKGYQSAK